MMIYPGEPGPYLLAHRGYSGIAPENTLAAFDEALNRRIPGVELDVHLCGSEELVVTHDDNLKRVTGFDGIVETLDYSNIRKLDAGRWKDEKYRGERIPLLQDVFDLLGDRVYYDIEIKSRSRGDNGLALKLFNLIREYNLEQRVIVSSFNPMSIKFFKQSAAGIPTAIIYSRSKELPWYLRHGEGRLIGSADILKPEHGMIGKITGKRPVLPWTVNEPDEARRLLEAGACGIISNNPAELEIESMLRR